MVGVNWINEQGDSLVEEQDATNVSGGRIAEADRIQPENKKATRDPYAEGGPMTLKTFATVYN